MSLLVYAARLDRRLRDADLLDITRQGAQRLQNAGKPAPGAPFAPTWLLLNLAHRGHIDWEEYRRRYTAEMRDSYRDLRPAWDALLAQPRAVLACVCVEADRCHRSVLADILGQLGATLGGELGVLTLDFTKPRQRLFSDVEAQRPAVAHLGAHNPAPALCHHGQRQGVCGACKPEVWAARGAK